jgi:hypothetical protein
VLADTKTAGKARIPYEAKPLHDAIAAAEDLSDDPAADELEGVPIPEDLELEENETLHLPPTPSQLSAFETMTFKEVCSFHRTMTVCSNFVFYRAGR